MGFAIFCGPVIALCMTEMRSYNQTGSRTSETGNRLEVESREGKVVCAGPELHGPTRTHVVAFCPKAKREKGEPKQASGNYITIMAPYRSTLAGSSTLKIKSLTTDKCQELDPAFVPACSCSGLLDSLLKNQNKQNTIEVEFPFYEKNSDETSRAEECRCYLGAAQRNGYRHVTVVKLGAWAHITQNVGATCDKIFKKAEKMDHKWNSEMPWKITKNMQCVGPPKIRSTDKEVTAWCPKDDLLDKRKSGNFMTVTIMGPKKDHLHVDPVLTITSRCPETPCSCNGLLGRIFKKKDIQRATTILSSVITTKKKRRAEHCKCYLGKAKANGYKFVEVDNCKGKYNKPQLIMEEFGTTCNDIFKQCKELLTHLNLKITKKRKN